MLEIPEQLAGLIVIVGVGFLASVAGNVATIIRSFRRTPPIDQSLQEYAKRTEVHALAAQSDAAYARKAEFETFRDDMRRNCAATHDRADKTFGEIFEVQRSLVKEVTDRLDRNHAAISDWQRGIERQIGKLESDANNRRPL